MFGPTIKNVFASRWHALLWAASILLTAYCSVPHEGETQTGEEAAMKAMLGQPVETSSNAPASEHHHVNPWAKHKT